MAMYPEPALETPLGGVHGQGLKLQSSAGNKELRREQ